jgi:Xaa-Pro dipeptidase
MQDWDDDLPFGLPFALEEYQDRMARVRHAMAEAGLDLLMVTSPENIYWLTGYRTTGYYVYQIFLLPLDGTPQFVTSRLEHECVRALSWIKTGLTVFMGEDEVAITLQGCEATGAPCRQIGYEERGFWLPPRILDAVRGKWGRGATKPAGHILEHARRIKSPAELAAIREAARIASAGMKAGLAAVQPGKTENQVAGEVYRTLMEEGGEHPAGGPYVVTGPRSAVTHMLPERAVIEPGHTIYFEVGGCYKRYSGSLMRMASVGKPGNEAAHRAAVSIEALESMIATIRPGVTPQDVDRAGRGAMKKGGLGEEFRHRAGYSLGVAFAPGWGEGLVDDIAEGNERPLEPGQVFHLVPMAGFRGTGNMGFSETVLVTETGCEVLTEAPRQLHICDT